MTFDTKFAFETRSESSVFCFKYNNLTYSTQLNFSEYELWQLDATICKKQNFKKAWGKLEIKLCFLRNSKKIFSPLIYLKRQGSFKKDETLVEKVKSS